MPAGHDLVFNLFSSAITSTSGKSLRNIALGALVDHEHPALDVPTLRVKQDNPYQRQKILDVSGASVDLYAPVGSLQCFHLGPKQQMESKDLCSCCVPLFMSPAGMAQGYA